jgi:multimeric flavodoxin WrbA
MNNILGVVGSPRKNGNTHIIVSKILEGAKNKGSDTELIFLDDLRILECDGCDVCFKGKNCIKMDDMNKIYPKIIKSDIIIFGTPVYWFGPTALMKAFLDRFVYFNYKKNREKIRGKIAVIVVPFEDEIFETASPTVQMFEKSFEYLEMNLIDKIIVPGVGPKGAVLRKQSVIDSSIKLGEKLSKY